MQARRKIDRGTLILEEAPLLRITVGRMDLFQESLFLGAGEYSGGPAVFQEFNKLSSEDQLKYLQLHFEHKPQEWTSGRVLHAWQGTRGTPAMKKPRGLAVVRRYSSSSTASHSSTTRASRTLYTSGTLSAIAVWYML